MIKWLKRESDLLDLSVFDHKMLILVIDIIVVLCVFLVELDPQGSPGMFFVQLIFIMAMQASLARVSLHDVKIVMSSKWHGEASMNSIIKVTFVIEMIGIVCMELLTLLVWKTRGNAEIIIRNLVHSIPIVVTLAIVFGVLSAFMWQRVSYCFVLLGDNLGTFVGGYIIKFVPRDWNVYTWMAVFFGIAVVSFLLQAIFTKLLFSTKLARKLRDKQLQNDRGIRWSIDV